MTDGPVLLDSDTLSELSRGRPRVVANARRYLVRHGRFTVSAVTVFERLRGYHLGLRTGKAFESHLVQFEALVSTCRVLSVEVLVATAAAQIWAALPARSRNRIGDILIAATAVSHGLPLVTRNRRDFERIARLDGIVLPLLDWTR